MNTPIPSKEEARTTFSKQQEEEIAHILYEHYHQGIDHAIEMVKKYVQEVIKGDYSENSKIVIRNFSELIIPEIEKLKKS